VDLDCADYESELCIVIGKACKNVSEADALNYVLGYTAGNDVSSRHHQFSQSQWCYSKGFDKACPIGPVIASTKAIRDPATLKIRGLKNGAVVQQSGLE
jgi:2-keto-4-pentenoate hydratase/2-oxohepta-3-ene-1,7-dioic acid hydratase in catechol pathway